MQRLLGLLVSSVSLCALAWGCSAAPPASSNNTTGGTTGTSGATSASGGTTTPSNGGNTGTTSGGNTGTTSGGNTGTTSGGNTGTTSGGNTGTTSGGNTGTTSGGNTGTTSGGAAGNTSTTGGAAGSGTGGAAGMSGTNPPGYWTSKDWKGCSWTGKDKLGKTTLAPMDFVTKAAADPYCISGTVGADATNFASVALLGFNVNEPNTASCVYNPATASAVGPPVVTPSANGIAVNFVKRGANTGFTLRVQIQGPNAGMPDPVGAADRWCATITEVQGKIFVPYSSFTPKCWETVVAMRGTPFNPATQKFDAVVFTVPGGAADVPYDFCVNGLAYGTTAADAPDGSATAGDQKGTVGADGGAAPYPLDFARAKVNVGGENYIIQNNNWGNPAGTFLQLTYLNNSFKVTGGSGTGGDAPASFPSIYIGNNGNTMNGVFSTSTTDNLPVQISAITSAPSTFRYSGSTNQYNATYDIWFAKSIPTAQYNDGIDGFVMIWLRDPSGKQPISDSGTTPRATNVMVGGYPWNVFVGPRGPGPMGSVSTAPVVSFVNPTENADDRAQSFKNIDLKAFFTAAAQYGITSNMYLTDVFGGFEIWNGGSGGNLSVDEFTAVVNK